MQLIQFMRAERYREEQHHLISLCAGHLDKLFAQQPCMHLDRIITYASAGLLVDSLCYLLTICLFISNGIHGEVAF